MPTGFTPGRGGRTGGSFAVSTGLEPGGSGWSAGADLERERPGRAVDGATAGGGIATGGGDAMKRRYPLVRLEEPACEWPIFFWCDQARHEGCGLKAFVLTWLRCACRCHRT